MTPDEQIRHLRITAKTLRHRAARAKERKIAVLLSPEAILDLAIALDELVEFRTLLVESEQVPVRIGSAASGANEPRPAA